MESIGIHRNSDEPIWIHRNSVLDSYWIPIWIPIRFLLDSHWISTGSLSDSWWIPIEFQLDSYWIPPGFSLDSCWIPTGFFSDSYWIPTEFQLDSYWIPPWFLLDLSWILAGFLLDPYPIPTGSLLDFYGIPIGFRLDSFWMPMGFLLVSCWFPIRFLLIEFLLDSLKNVFRVACWDNHCGCTRFRIRLVCLCSAQGWRAVDSNKTATWSDPSWYRPPCRPMRTPSSFESADSSSELICSTLTRLGFGTTLPRGAERLATIIALSLGTEQAQRFNSQTKRAADYNYHIVKIYNFGIMCMYATHRHCHNQTI